MLTTTNTGGKTTAIHARVEPKLKSDVEKIFGQIGLSMSDAINMFLRQVKMQKGLPFEAKVPNRRTRKALEDSMKGIGLKRYSSAKELFDEYR